MKKQFTTLQIEKSGDKIMFVASDETRDRYGEIIPFDHWDLRAFKKAPRLLVDHDHRVEKIVGKAKGIKVEKEKKRLVFEAVFHEVTELAKQVKELVLAGFLNTVSVGFIPWPPDNDKDKETAKKEGKFMGRNELLEISFVTVPANPNASQIKALMDKDEKIEVKEDIEEFIVPKVSGEITVKQTEVQTLVFSKKTYNKDKAIKWAKEHSFKADKVDETENSYRLRQFNPDMCTEGSLRTISLAKGVKAVICKQAKSLKTSPSGNEKQDDTHRPQAKGKPDAGRSLVSTTLLQKRALKEAGKIISHALYKSKKEKINE